MLNLVACAAACGEVGIKQRLMCVCYYFALDVLLNFRIENKNNIAS